MTTNKVITPIWLSHVLSVSTPVYGNGVGLRVRTDKNIECGDSCNTVSLSLSNHLGSHVDSPRHFITSGATTETYQPDEWIFNKALIINLTIAPAEIITVKHIEKQCDDVFDADLVLIKTGFEIFRGDRKYWESAPAYSPELAVFLKNKFKSFTAIGMDTLSISSFQHRELGREAHKAFLQNEFRIFEDLSLKELNKNIKLRKVIALPLRFEHSDGAPCSIIGWIDE